MQPNTVESGTRLADRYRLEECLRAEDGFTTWRAVDEKLSRYVGVHVLPADAPRAKSVVQAAQAAAMLNDGRFCQVLDASQQDDITYVVEERLRGAYLPELLRNGPLAPAEAAALTREAATALTVAHDAGLAHLCLNPTDVLRTETGQLKIFGLSVAAALRGVEVEDKAAADTKLLGSLLYACLTAKWPDGEADGLPAAPHEHGTVCSPAQVRAGVPATLDEIVMRALLDDPPGSAGPLRTPEDFAAALAKVPRLRRPEREVGTQVMGAVPDPGMPGMARVSAPPAAPPGPSRSGRAVGALVALLVIAGVVLFGLSLLDNLQGGGGRTAGNQPSASAGPQGAPAGSALKIAAVKDFDPPGKNSNGEENPGKVKNAWDGDPNTVWETAGYNDAKLSPFKPGVGLIVDLGAPTAVGSVTVTVKGDTVLDLRVAGESEDSQPEDLGGFTKVDEKSGSGELVLQAGGKESRYVLVWLTQVPDERGSDGRVRGRIAEISVRS